MEAFESLHQRYDHSPFNQSFPLNLANNKPMFTSSLRAFRNTDCSRTTRIWVLYEEEVQNMETDQNLIFNVDISDSLSTDDVFHTPDGGSPLLLIPILIPHLLKRWILHLLKDPLFGGILFIPSSALSP